MKRRQTQVLGALVRAKGFTTDHPITPAIPRATALVTDVGTLIAGYGAAGANQVGGFGSFRGGSTERKILGDQIYTVLLDMSSVAKGLDPEEYPGIADRFRVSQSRRSYQGLINTGAAFVEAVEEPTVKTLFTDRGFAADFDDELTASLVTFAAATGRKFDGVRNRKEGTVSLEFLDKKAARVLKELRAIMVKHLRQTSPDLIDVWLAATRVYRSSAEAEEATAPVDGASSDSGTPVTSSGS